MWIDLFKFVVAVVFRPDLRRDCHKPAAAIRVVTSKPALRMAVYALLTKKRICHSERSDENGVGLVGRFGQW